MLRPIRKSFSAPEPAPIAPPATSAHIDPAKALADAAQERATALASLETIAGRRAALLAEDASDQALEAIDVEAARLRRQVERFDAAAPRLRAAVAAEKAAGTEAAFVEAFASYRLAQTAFLEALADATAKRDALETAARALQIFGRGYERFPPRDLPLFEPQVAGPYRDDVAVGFAAERRRQPGDWA